MMTRTEYALFLLTDGDGLHTPEAVQYATGYSVNSEQNRLICAEVERVHALWDKTRASIEEVRKAEFTEREKAILHDYSTKNKIPDLVSRAIRKAIK